MAAQTSNINYTATPTDQFLLLAQKKVSNWMIWLVADITINNANVECIVYIYVSVFFIISPLR